MQGGKQPTAAQKRWQSAIAQTGCYVTGGEACIHHCVGSTARHNKVDIGHWFVIPLSYEAHQGKHGIHGDRKLFNPKLGERRLEIEKSIFFEVISDLPDYWIDDRVWWAIREYHR